MALSRRQEYHNVEVREDTANEEMSTSKGSSNRKQRLTKTENKADKKAEGLYTEVKDFGITKTTNSQNKRKVRNQKKKKKGKKKKKKRCNDRRKQSNK